MGLRSQKSHEESIATSITTTTSSTELPSQLEKQLQYMMTRQTQRRHVFNSWILFSAVAVVAFASLGVSTVLTILDAVRLTLTVSSWRGISLAAAVTGGCALISIVVLAICRMGCSGVWFHRWVLPWVCAIIAVAAATLSVNALVLKTLNQKEVEEAQEGIPDILVQYVLWGIAVVAELIFYAFVIMRRAPHDTTPPTPSPPPMREHKKAPQRPPSPPEPLRLVAPPYALPQASTPLCMSPSKTDYKRLSWRDSLSSFRPTTSRTKLLGSRTSLSRNSSTRSANTAESDAFDSWDTSNVDLQMREAISPSMPSKGRTLEPIPGSRPASPATALNGPFKATDEAPSKFFPERPPTAASTTSQSTVRGGKRTFIAASRPSEGGDESHIHPLFRTDSPTPPPGISSNTIVTASPMGGQAIHTPMLPGRPASRMRSASQLSTRTVSRSGSRAPSRAESFDSTRRTESLDERRLLSNTPSHLTSPPLPPPTSSPFTSPIPTSSPFTNSSPYSSNLHLETAASTPSALPHRQLSVNSSSSRSASPSPISRKMTPPIPEFILSAQMEGPRMKASRETLRSGSSLMLPPGTAL